MKKTKFWLMQIVMVSIVSLAFGASVFAKDMNAEKDQKFIEKLDKKFDKKMTKHSEKEDKWKKWYDKKMSKHNAKYHGGDNPHTYDPGNEVCPDGTEGDYPDCTPVDPPVCIPDFGNPCP